MRELHPVFESRDKLEARSLLPAAITVAHPTHWVYRVVRSQAPAQGLPPQATPHNFFQRDFWYYTNAMVPFARAPLNLTIALLEVLPSWLRRSVRNSTPWCAWRARESLDWTRGATPMRPPRTRWLARLDLFSSSDCFLWIAPLLLLFAVLPPSFCPCFY